MAAPLGVVCAKCGAAAQALVPACERCGGQNVRLCPSCGHHSSLGKGFCDKCGRPTSAPPPAAPPVPNLPTGIPATAIRSLPPAPEPPTLPPAGRATGAYADYVPPTPEESDEPPPPPPKPLSPPVAFALRALKAAAATLVVLGAAGAAAYWHRGSRPEIAGPRAAKQYLAALQARDFKTAYDLFSTESRQYCTLDEFSASRPTSTWTWSDLAIEYKEPGAILLSYRLAVEGAAPRKDHLLFVEEPGRGWVRPYTWTLMQQVENAFGAGDAEKGLILAERAASVNPRDPMARGYLCEAAYYRKAPAETVEHCVAAIALARIYPSNLTLKSLYHLHAILADTYKNSLGNPERALDQFAQMLAFPRISPADQCEIRLARAEAYAALSRPGEALADLDAGAGLCTRPEDLAYVETVRSRIAAPETNAP